MIWVERLMRVGALAALVLLTPVLVLYWIVRMDPGQYGMFERDDRIPNITRWILVRCPSFRIFLHHAYGPDPDRHMHNHPWRGFSIILRGGYYERVKVRRPGAHAWHRFHRRHGAGTINVLGWYAYHQIVSVRPNTWTLVFAGRYAREWGFLVNSDHVDWRKYLKIPATFVGKD